MGPHQPAERRDRRRRRPASPGPGRRCSSGRLAALDAAHLLGRIGEAERDRRAAPLRAALARERAIRPFLDALYRPADSVLCPADDVIVCRCEEVTAGQIRRAVRLGAQGPNQVKAFIRCGMGPCQGRLCGPVAQRRDRPGARRADRGGRHLPAARALQADHRRCAGRDCSVGVTEPGVTVSPGKFRHIHRLLIAP